MSLHFINHYPLIGTDTIDGYTFNYAWVWEHPSLRITFADNGTLLGRVTHLDGLPRLVPGSQGLAWLNQDDPTRTRAILDQSINLWQKKDQIFRTCNG
ncbi:hypothetical protein AB0B28_20415 [Glycomyces sp. NPDC046736]|uniref:hypothetical protein n=1 Tax=Glycomyces sp. NPDC046736 TaxID=3155615 RepID=UPI0033E5F80F